MKYIEIYETRDKKIYNEIISLFIDSGIDYKTLFEYRLYPEKVFEGGAEGALIKVLQKDFLTANHILISKGFKSQFESRKFKLVDRFERLFINIPVVNKLPRVYRLMLMVIIGIITVLGSLILIPLILVYLFNNI